MAQPERKLQGNQGMSLKQKALRDRRYLDWLRTQPCIITGHYATEWLAIDPAHVGTAGKGIKSPDNEALPLRHDLHSQAHTMGEMSFYRRHLPDDVLRAALRALAREMYQEYLKSR